MAEGDLITGPWQVELQGILMDGQGGANGAALTIVRWLTGFGVPPGRVMSVDKPLQHGSFPGPQYMDDRSMTVAVLARGDTWDDLMDAVNDLGMAFAPVPDTDEDYVVPMVFTMDDETVKYRVYGRPTRAEWGYSAPAHFGTEPCAFADAALCEFLASDPRLYFDTLHSQNLTLGVTSGGLDISDHTFPHGFGSASSGAAVCTNDGNVMTYPVITVTAGGSGASGIELQNTTTGKSWSITLTVAAGDTLVVDFGARSALLNGTASRSPFINRPPSEWWGLQPGDNTVVLQATGAGTTATVQWRDARLM